MSISEKRERRLEIAFVIAIGLYMLLWSIVKPFNYAPDEQMRYDLPLYIYKHGRLPLGDDPEIRDQVWGFSYAFMPTWLEPLLAAFFMHIVSFLFGAGNFKLVVAARFVSVLAISGMVYCLTRTLDRLFSKRIKWVTLVLIAMIPQVTFLGSYVNQDSLNMFGASMILLAWICGVQDGWNYKNGTLLAVGIVIVALSYYFGYGWILGSIIFFFVTNVFHIGPNKMDKKMWKITGLICVIVLGCISFFFIRNLVIYHGDLLGRTSMAEAQALYAAEEMKPENHLSLMAQGNTFNSLIMNHEWWKSTLKSFIGCFGYMQFPVPDWVCGAYYFIFFFVIIMFIVSTVRVIYNKQYASAVTRTLIIFEFVLPVILSLWYSYSSDYQPQGRYIMSLLPALAIETAVGIDTMEKDKDVTAAVIVVMVIGLALFSFEGVYLPS